MLCYIIFYQYYHCNYVILYRYYMLLLSCNIIPMNNVYVMYSVQIIACQTPASAGVSEIGFQQQLR